MTISFNANFLDYWNYFNYLSWRTVTGRFLVLFLALLPILEPLFLLYKSPLHSPMHHFLLRHFWIILAGIAGITYLVYAFSFAWGLFLSPAIIRRQSITINQDSCVIRNIFTSKVRWRHFLRVTEEPEYFYFLGWLRTAFIPKRVFESQAEAEAFFDLAVSYWRQAKGLPSPPIPNTAGVWPPAPRPANSQEPDARP